MVISHRCRIPKHTWSAHSQELVKQDLFHNLPAMQLLLMVMNIEGIILDIENGTKKLEIL